MKFGNEGGASRRGREKGGRGEEREPGRGRGGVLSREGGKGRGEERERGGGGGAGQGGKGGEACFIWARGVRYGP